MMHLLLIFTLLFSLLRVSPTTPISSGGPKPDFSGVWSATIVRPASQLSTGLRITYRDPELKITRIPIQQQPILAAGKEGPELVYYTDGRGEKQKSDSSKSKTERTGEKFVITSNSKDNVILADMPDVSNPNWGKAFLESLVSSGSTTITGQVITLEVSSDGKTLTETTALTGKDYARRFVRLYDRVAGKSVADVNGEWL